MEKDIWKNVKDDEEKSERNVVNISNKLRNYNFSMNWFNLRNYINTYSVNKINISTLESWFGNNLYQFDENGNSILHLLSILRYIPIEKRCKALEISFKILGPNFGSHTAENYNYFQCCFLNLQQKYQFCNSTDLNKIYEIGIKYGLDINYVDSYNNSFVAYLLSVAPFKIIDELYEFLLTPENVSEWEKNIKILKVRTDTLDMCIKELNFVNKTLSDIICPRYKSKIYLNCNNEGFLKKWNSYDLNSYSNDEELKNNVYNNIKKRIKELSK